MNLLKVKTTITVEMTPGELDLMIRALRIAQDGVIGDPVMMSTIVNELGGIQVKMMDKIGRTEF